MSGKDEKFIPNLRQCEMKDHMSELLLLNFNTSYHDVVWINRRQLEVARSCELAMNFRVT
jgi:hypothetical protein